MRFATYNVWNSDMPRRYAQLLHALRVADADVIALQECTEDFFRRALSAVEDWPHRVFENYDGEDEGLAILSRYPLRESCFLHRLPEYDRAAALHVLIDAPGAVLSVTNVHLPWDSVLAREKQSVAIQRYADGQQADFALLMGDFNGGPEASCGRFFAGQQSLLGCEASPPWNDLAHSWSCLSGAPVRPTLDTVHNPRWRGSGTPYAPVVMDRICLRDSWHSPRLTGAGLFGTEECPETGLCPSDHYGVYADVILSREDAP